MLATSLALLTVGCGGATDAVPAGPTAVPTTATTPNVLQAPNERPTTRQTPWRATGHSMGVDRTAWPGTAREAKTLLDALPSTPAGKRWTVTSTPAEEDWGATAIGEYGSDASISVSDEYVSRDTASGKPELFSAPALLVASFGLVMACAEGSYHGSLPEHPDYPAPTIGEKPLTKPAWFACAVDTAEGDDDFTGYAVGWTSKKAAWLLVAPDEKTARTMVVALQAAS